jgi:hypothetical protein
MGARILLLDAEESAQRGGRGGQVYLSIDRRARPRALCRTWAGCHVERAAATSGWRQSLHERRQPTLIALACSNPPEGGTSWTMQLLADELVFQRVLSSVSGELARLLTECETIRQ